MTAAVAAALIGGCARNPASPGGGADTGRSGNDVAAMFLRNMDKLPQASGAVETSLGLDLSGFVTPLAGNTSNEVTLEFIVSNKEDGPSLVIAAIVPYQVGDVVQGPGARFVPLESPAFLLAPGEKKQISIKAIRERIPVRTPGTAETKPTGAPESPMTSQRSFKPVQQASPTPLFDPKLGVQVLVVVQEASAVDGNVVSQIRAVSDADFERVYGKFSRRLFSIPVPPQQIL